MSLRVVIFICSLITSLIVFETYRSERIARYTLSSKHYLNPNYCIFSVSIRKLRNQQKKLSLENPLRYNDIKKQTEQTLAHKQQLKIPTVPCTEASVRIRGLSYLSRNESVRETGCWL